MFENILFNKNSGKPISNFIVKEMYIDTPVLNDYDVPIITAKFFIQNLSFQEYEEFKSLTSFCLHVDGVEYDVKSCEIEYTLNSDSSTSAMVTFKSTGEKGTHKNENHVVLNEIKDDPKEIDYRVSNKFELLDL